MSIGILSGALNGVVVRTPAWAEALRQLRLAARHPAALGNAR